MSCILLSWKTGSTVGRGRVGTASARRNPVGGHSNSDLVDDSCTTDTVCTVRQKQTALTATFLCVERGRDSWQDKKDLGVGDDGDPCEVPSSQAVLGRGRERIP